MQLPTAGSAKSPRRSIMRLAALNTRRASGLRARYAQPLSFLTVGGITASATPCPDCAFRDWTPVVADPHQPRPSLRSPHPSMPPLELSGRRRFLPVPLLRLDVGGVKAHAEGSAGSALGLGGISLGLDCHSRARTLDRRSSGRWMCAFSG